MTLNFFNETMSEKGFYYTLQRTTSVLKQELNKRLGDSHAISVKSCKWQKSGILLISEQPNAMSNLEQLQHDILIELWVSLHRDEALLRKHALIGTDGT